MAILTLPATPSFRSLRFRLRWNTQTSESPLNRSAQTLELLGPRWELEGELPPMTPEQAAPWRVLMVQSRGESGRIYMGDASRAVPRGIATGTPLVKGASQTGRSLITDGWTPSITGILQEADYVAWDLPDGSRQMVMLVADANSDGSGNATLSFEPPIRVSPADNAPLIVQAPTCIMRFTDDGPGWDVQEALFEGMAIGAVESFYATV